MFDGDLETDHKCIESFGVLCGEGKNDKLQTDKINCLRYLEDGFLGKYCFIGYETGFQIFNTTDFKHPMLTINFLNGCD